MLRMEARTRQPPRPFDLRAERLNRGYSRKGLADVIGVHREVLRRLENKTGGITPANALLIADWFGVTVVELLGDELRPCGCTWDCLHEPNATCRKAAAAKPGVEA